MDRETRNRLAPRKRSPMIALKPLERSRKPARWKAQDGHRRIRRRRYRRAACGNAARPSAAYARFPTCLRNPTTRSFPPQPTRKCAPKTCATRPSWNVCAPSSTSSFRTLQASSASCSTGCSAADGTAEPGRDFDLEEGYLDLRPPASSLTRTAPAFVQDGAGHPFPRHGW